LHLQQAHRHNRQQAFTKRQDEGAKVNLVRYADDFIVTGNDRALLADRVMPIVTSFLVKRGLTLAPEKNKSHPHYRWIRLPWSECTTLRQEIAGQTI
jgi:hypothetical protein